MALCEIQTAGTSNVGKVPRECEEWKRTKSGVRLCVEALSRSPQHWSSYSQNLRDVVTLCSSYRRWADIEDAKSLYALAAKHLSEFIAHLKSFEDDRSKRARGDTVFHERTTSELRTLISQLSRMADHQQHSVDELVAQHRTALETFSSVGESHATQLANMVDIISARGLEKIGLALQGIAATHSEELHLITESMRLEIDSSLRILDTSVEGVLRHHNDLSSAIMSNVENVVRASSSVQTLVQRSSTLADSLHRLTNQTEKQMADLETLVANYTATIHSSYANNDWVVLGWTSIWNGIIYGGIGLKGVIFALLSLVVGYRYPAIMCSSMVFAVLAALYPLISCLVRNMSKRKRIQKNSILEPVPVSSKLESSCYSTSSSRVRRFRAPRFNARVYSSDFDDRW